MILSRRGRVSLICPKKGMRMDDTNPTKEDVEYVQAIQEDIHWLGFDWGDRFFYASDYFEKMYECA